MLEAGRWFASLFDNGNARLGKQTNSELLNRGRAAARYSCHGPQYWVRPPPAGEPGLWHAEASAGPENAPLGARDKPLKCGALWPDKSRG